ncbi:MAG: NUDIX domain-containing protein [Tissierellia bacterium]|nr:NUDIX domain-containing protein [Tissierellia bacterium]
MEEYWDLYDENRVSLNRTHLRGVPLNSGEYHIVIEIWVLTKDGIIITKRQEDKPYGNLWEGTGGSILSGETSLEGAKRELLEEIGLDVDEDELKLFYSIKSNTSFKDFYYVRKNVNIGELVLQEEEVSDAKIVSFDELMVMWNNKLMVPTLYIDNYSKDLLELLNR